MGMGGPPKPNLPTIPPPSAHPAMLGTATMDSTLRAQKDRAASTNPFTSNKTIATSPMGDTSTPTAAKSTLLGQ